MNTSRLILIHGFGDGAFVWDGLLSHFEPSRSLMTVDLRGHGDAPRDTPSTYHPAAYAADLVSLIDELTQVDVVLVGHSLGAEVAIRAAAARAERIAGLVIVDGGPGLNEEAALALLQHMATLPWRYRTVAEYESSLTEWHPLASADVLRRYAMGALRATPDGAFELKLDPALRSGLPPADVPAIWSSLQSIRCPALLVRGAASAFLSHRSAAYVCTRVRTCRLVTVPRAGHAIPLDNPQGLHSVVTSFLAEVLPSQPLSVS